MALIPQTNESPERKRMRQLEEKMDDLIDKVGSLEHSASTKVPSAKEEVPNAVKFAAHYLEQFKACQRSYTETNSFGSQDNVAPYVPMHAEISAAQSAAELIEDYFDRNNSRVIEGRKRARDAKQSTENQAAEEKPKRKAR